MAERTGEVAHMSSLLSLSLIRFFSFYLAFMFLLSTALRLRQYYAILSLVGRFRGRWPKLFQLVRQHLHIFLTWGTVMPLAVVLVLLLLNTVASQWIWPQADQFTLADLLALWPALPVVGLCTAAMLTFDLYATWNVGTIDQHETEKYFDQAEFWLVSWKAPVVRFFTLGFINPRQMVATEVRASLVSVSQMLTSTLWWVSIQTGLRIACGLSLWGTYALEPWLRRLMA
jgi:hypothetical protein